MKLFRWVVAWVAERRSGVGDAAVDIPPGSQNGLIVEGVHGEHGF